jgi:hypothetical protein
MPVVDRADGALVATHKKPKRTIRAQSASAETAPPVARRPPTWLPTLTALTTAYAAAVHSMKASPRVAAASSHTADVGRRTQLPAVVPSHDHGRRFLATPPFEHMNSTGTRAPVLPPLMRNAESSSRVLAQRLASLVVRDERLERADLQRSEKVAWSALAASVLDARARYNYAVDAAAAGAAAPDSALIASPSLAHGSPSRARRLAGGVGLGIGGVVNVAPDPAPVTAKERRKNAKIDTVANAKRVAVEVANTYDDHDLRPRGRRDAARRVHYHHPVAPGTRVEWLPTKALPYEARMVFVKELQDRQSIERRCQEKWLWLERNEATLRIAATERERSSRAQHDACVAADKRRRQVSRSVVAGAIDRAIAEMEREAGRPLVAKELVRSSIASACASRSASAVGARM